MGKRKKGFFGPDYISLHLAQYKSKTTESSKCHEVTIANKIWTGPNTKKTSKANSSLRYIKRNIKTSNKKAKEASHKTYIRPQVEYCPIFWQKHLAYKVLSMQWAAARYVFNNYVFTCSVICHQIVTGSSVENIISKKSS